MQGGCRLPQRFAQAVNRGGVRSETFGPGLKRHVLGEPLLMRDSKPCIADQFKPLIDAQAAPVAGVAQLLKGIVGDDATGQ